LAPSGLAERLVRRVAAVAGVLRIAMSVQVSHIVLEFDVRKEAKQGNLIVFALPHNSSKNCQSGELWDERATRARAMRVAS